MDRGKGRAVILVEKKYEPAMLGVESVDELCVIWWRDRHDEPGARSTLQVNAKGGTDNPTRGVFATRSLARPNPIAITRCKVITVRKNIIEIERIDGDEFPHFSRNFPDSPVLDIKGHLSRNPRPAP
jgi:tRNA (Thr-GGU) A37 N-methylase